MNAKSGKGKKIESEDPETSNEDPKKGTMSEDQRKRGYYYDDAHGYRDYDPQMEEPEEDSTIEMP